MIALSEVYDLAREAHKGQLDKQGRDYYAHHLLPVVAVLAPYGEHAEMAGVLHDIIEDTPTTYTELISAGVPGIVVDAVAAVTRREGEAYVDLIARAARHPLGRLVKLADNWVNLSGLDALAVTDAATAARLLVRYVRARGVLVAAVESSR